MRHYLIVYRPSDGVLVHFKSFGEENQRQALAAGSALKRVNLGRKDVEIHLLGAENLEALRKMCPQYFMHYPLVFTDPGHCHETYEFSDFALSCDNFRHVSWPGDPDLHRDPEWELIWAAD
jgi:hypothetical protein